MMIQKESETISPIAISRRRIGRLLDKIPDAPVAKPACNSIRRTRVGHRFLAMIFALLTLGIIGNLAYSAGSGAKAGLLSLKKTLHPGLTVRCSNCGKVMYNVKSIREGQELIGDSNGICFGCHTCGNLRLAISCSQCGFVYDVNVNDSTRTGQAAQPACPVCGSGFDGL